MDLLRLDVSPDGLESMCKERGARELKNQGLVCNGHGYRTNDEMVEAHVWRCGSCAPIGEIRPSSSGFLVLLRRPARTT
jgi:hypothetical protein